LPTLAQPRHPSRGDDRRQGDGTDNMASASSTSPFLDYAPLLGEATPEDDEWAFLDPSGSSNPGSIGILPSPASGSLASWGVIGTHGQARFSPPAPSPLYLDPTAISGTFPEQPSSVLATDGTGSPFLDTVASEDVLTQFMTPGAYLFDDPALQGKKQAAVEW
jgi:hypothetical protein